MLFSQGQKILFTGDSITDCGRRDEAHQPFGRGYVSMVTSMLDGCCGELELTYINRGISGNTAIDLQNRWQEDCIDLEPDWVSILIGVNDAHRFYRDGQAEFCPEDFKKVCRENLTQVVGKTSARIILWEPFFFVTPQAGAPQVKEVIGKYIDATNELAKEFSDRVEGVIHTDEIFVANSKKRPMEFWVPEGVHPSQSGHGLMAVEFLKFAGMKISA